MRLLFLLVIPFVILGLFTNVYADIANAIKLYVSPPTETRLGGVLAQECPANQWILGIATNGTILCGEIIP